MAFRYEHYSNTGGITVWSTPFWQGNFRLDIVHQTFTPQISHTITSVRLFLRKTDNTQVSLWSIGIRATDGNGTPTGSVLAGFFENPIIADTAFDWQWIEFTLSSGLALTAGVTYSIGFTVQLSGAAKTLQWARRATNVYPRGQIWHFVWRFPPETPNWPNGEYEDGIAEGDHLFQEWGIGTRPPPDEMPSFPDERPDAYDPDLIWVPGEWTDPDTYVPPEWGEPSRYFATGGGQWGQQLVVVGNGKVYYSELN